MIPVFPDAVAGGPLPVDAVTGGPADSKLEKKYSEHFDDLDAGPPEDAVTGGPLSCLPWLVLP